MIENSTLGPSFLNKIVYKVWQTICYSPWAWLILLTLFALGTTIEFGNWPSYGNPDPSFVSDYLQPLYFLSVIGIPLLLVSLPIWAVLLATTKRTIPFQFRKQGVHVYLWGMTICATAVLTDFAGLITWILD